MLGLPSIPPVKLRPAGHTSHVASTSMLGLPHISAKSYYPLTYHCTRYYNTGLTIYQLQVLIISNYLIIPLLFHMYVQLFFLLHTSTIPPHTSIYIYIYIYSQHHVIQSLIILIYQFQPSQHNS